MWDVATSLLHGPHKRDLDDISRLRPIMLNDNSGHSVWVNSAFLRLFGIDADTPDLSRNLSHVVRDEKGEPPAGSRSSPCCRTAVTGSCRMPTS